MSTNERRVDPDPFGVIVAIATIVAGVASGLDLYRRANPDTAFKARRRIRDRLERLTDLLRYLAADVEVIRDVLASADVPGNRRFRFGVGVFMTPGQVDRYDEATDDALDRLRRVLRITHSLEKEISQVEQPDSVPRISDILEGLRTTTRRLLVDEDLTVDEALDNLETVLQTALNVAQEVARTTEL